MPGMSGIQACEAIRSKHLTPILFITAKSTDTDKVIGFSAGGDDYLVKPFSYTELLSRIKALLRRCYQYSGAAKPAPLQIIYIHDLQIDLEKQQVLKDDKEIELTDDTYVYYYYIPAILTSREPSDTYAIKELISAHTELAHGISQMRLAIIEKQLQDFIMKSQEKAFVMKELSDKLFEYFLVSQRVSEEYRMEDIPVSDLISGLLDNQIFDLQNQGFTVEASLFPETFNGICRMDVEFMQRVLDNILSNIRKYADPAVPVRITAERTNFAFSLCFENGTFDDPVCSESTGIGLKTCEKIMEEHHGRLNTCRCDATFLTEIILPVQNRHATEK